MTGLAIPGRHEPPCSGRLLDGAGRTVTRWERHRATRMRIMRLDDDGHPAGKGTEVGDGEVLIRTDPDPADDVPCYTGPVGPFPRATITVQFCVPPTGDRARGAHLL